MREVYRLRSPMRKRTKGELLATGFRDLTESCAVHGLFAPCMAIYGQFTTVLAKHSKSFALVDAISVGVDRMQRNFEPMRRQVESWRQTELTDVMAKMIIYQAFIEGELDVSRHLAR